MTKRKLNRQQKSRISARQKQIERDFAKTSDLEADDFQKALVISHHGKETLVEMPSEQKIKCYTRQSVGALVAGDKVLVDTSHPQKAVIVSRLNRNSVLGRLNNQGKLKPIAANIDNLIIVFAPKPEPSDLLIDSYLVAADFLNIKPLLVYNKIDLDDKIAIANHYQQLNYPLIKASSQNQQGLNELQSALENKTSVFVGQSGVGKSSLISTLLPHEKIETQQISSKMALGKHTTSNSFLYHMNDKKGAIIDSPGIREFSLGKLNPTDIIKGFPEFKALLGKCKYRNCRHQNEPECAIHLAAKTCLHKKQRANNLRRILQNHSIKL